MPEATVHKASTGPRLSDIGKEIVKLQLGIDYCSKATAI
jgi:hypothetical protein